MAQRYRRLITGRPLLQIQGKSVRRFASPMGSFTEFSLRPQLCRSQAPPPGSTWMAILGIVEWPLVAGDCRYGGDPVTIPGTRPKESSWKAQLNI
jgi:hypothetical protein